MARVRARATPTLFTVILILALLPSQLSLAATTNLSMTTTNPATSAQVSLNGTNDPITVAPNDVITATVSNGPGNPGDWLGVYAIGSPSGPSNPPLWKWLSTDDSRGTVPPPPGLTNGSVHLSLPNAAGQYQIRFFTNNSFNVAAISSQITSVIVIQPPTSVISVNPTSPQIPDTMSLGGIVARYTVTMSDGSSYTGSPVSFGPPNFDSNGRFSLSNGKIIVNPNGPGIGPNNTTITNSITLEATQP